MIKAFSHFFNIFLLNLENKSVDFFQAGQSRVQKCEPQRMPRITSDDSELPKKMTDLPIAGAVTDEIIKPPTH